MHRHPATQALGFREKGGGHLADSVSCQFACSRTVVLPVLSRVSESRFLWNTMTLCHFVLLLEHTGVGRCLETLLSIASESVSRLNRVQLFATLWTAIYQAPLSMEFSRQEYWSGLLFSSPGDLPDPGVEANQDSCTAGRSFTIWATQEASFLATMLTVFSTTEALTVHLLGV